jgi:hypothetical protein
LKSSKVKKRDFGRPSKSTGSNPGIAMTREITLKSQRIKALKSDS